MGPVEVSQAALVQQTLLETRNPYQVLGGSGPETSGPPVAGMTDN